MRGGWWWDRTLIGRAGYYIRIEVNPGNAGRSADCQQQLSSNRLDGGANFTIDTGGGCSDFHDISDRLKDPDHWIATATAAWASRATTAALHANRPADRQVIYVATDDQVPSWIYSNRQDDGTMRGPSDSPVAVSNVPSTPASPASARGREEDAGRGGRGGRGGGRGRRRSGRHRRDALAAESRRLRVGLHAAGHRRL